MGRAYRTSRIFGRTAVAVLSVGVGGGTASVAADLSLDHETIGCVVAERFPVVSARIAPAQEIASARVYPRADGGRHWYYVDMKPSGADYRATLPKPLKTTGRVQYYLEATNRRLDVRRTPDRSSHVVGSEAGCREGLVAAALGSAAVTVVAPAGAPALPSGFSPTGIVAPAGAGASAAATAGVAGAGMSTSLVIAGAAVAVAGGTAALVSAASGGAEPLPSPSPTPTCPAPPGTGPAQAQSFSWTLPGGATHTVQRFDLPFAIPGAGVVEARSTFASGFVACVCLGSRNVCRPDCSDEGVASIAVDVCMLPEMAPGQWWVQVYCAVTTQGSGVCATPLPAGGLSGVTTVTYTPR